MIVPPEKQKTRKGYCSIAAIDPADGRPWHVLVSHEKMDHIYKRGKGAVSELTDSVSWGLLHPKAVFQGVREEGEDTWLCYTSIPPHAYDHKDGRRVKPPWAGQVFLVFVNGDRVVYNWRWEKADLADPGLPAGYKNRFRKRVL